MAAEKLVYIVESHHHVLPAWAELRRTSEQLPRLLTFDYHTDTRPAFIAYATDHADTAARSWQTITTERLQQIDIRNEASLHKAVADLRWDEHIDAAIRAGILDIAFVAAYDNRGHIESNEQLALDAQRKPTEIKQDGGIVSVKVQPREIAAPPFTYRIPTRLIVVLPRAQLDRTGLDDDAAARAYHDAVLDAYFLRQHLDLIQTISASAGVQDLFARPFVLDFDLDYFNTKRSIAPSDTSVLDQLIQRASLITIARESSCVKNLQLEGEELDSDFLEDQLLKHVGRAAQAASQQVSIQRRK